MKLKLATLILALAPSAAYAQVHPCDAPIPTNPVIVKPSVIVGFCHGQKDTNGNPAVLTAFKLTIDGAVALTWTGPSLTPTSPAANNLGLWYYEAPAVPVGRGNHSVQVSAVSADGESALTTAYTFSTKGSLPQVVVGVRAR